MLLLFDVFKFCDVLFSLACELLSCLGSLPLLSSSNQEASVLRLNLHQQRLPEQRLILSLVKTHERKPLDEGV